MSEVNALWNRLQTRIKSQVSEQDFETWFFDVVLRESDDKAITLAAPSRMIKEWLESKYADVILNAAEEVLGKPTNLEIVVSEQPAAAAPKTAPPTTPKIDAPTLVPQYIFDTFVVGPSNRLSYAASLAVAENPGISYNPLFLHGAVGLGKTHLLQAICHFVVQNNPKASIQFLSCEQFVNHFITTIREGNYESFRDKYRNVDVLIIDDIQFLSEKERCQEEFFHTFNALFNAQKQIVIASDSPPQDLSSLEERLVSRFKSGLVAHLETPHYETRCAIVMQKAQLRGVDLPEPVVDYVATHLRSNVRELEGAVMKLISYSHLMKRNIDLPMAMEALKDSISTMQRSINIKDIQQAILDQYNLTAADLQSPRRTKSIAFPRQICMYLMRDMTDLSLEEIGDALGGRDHTTVLYAVDKIKKLLVDDSELRSTVNALKHQIAKS